MTSGNIKSLELPDWVNNLLISLGGLRKLDPVGLSDIGNTDIDCLCVYEDKYLEHKKLLVEALKQGTLRSLVIFNTHVFLLDSQTLDELDNLSKKFDIHLLAQGYYAKQYANLRVHHFEMEEHFISHHVNLLLTNRLQSRKKVQKTFLMQIVNKDNFRNTVIDAVAKSGIQADVLTPSAKTSSELISLKENFFKNIKTDYGNNLDIMSALDGFGSGLPNFELYEKTFCEIVAETLNLSGHAYMFTEKTFRPIAFGVPIIFLGSQDMYKTLLQYGYKFYDENFYQHWHDTKLSLSDKVKHLISFLQHIKESVGARSQMQSVAETNMQVFWNERKLYYYKNWNDIFDKICAGKNINRVIDVVYGELNF